MKWLVFSDKGTPGRHYWSEDRQKWVKLYDSPTIYLTEEQAQDVAMKFLMHDPDIAMWRFSGIGVTNEIGQPWNRSLDKP